MASAFENRLRRTIEMAGTDGQTGSVPVMAIPSDGVVGDIQANGVSLGIKSSAISASMLKKWRMALAKMANGDSNARLLWLGESTVNGSGAIGTGYQAGGRAKNAVVELAKILSATFAPARADTVIGCGNVLTYNVFDPRITLSGFTISSAGYVVGGTYTSATSGHYIDFAPAGQFDRIEVFYLKNAGHGTIDVSVDGGAALATINCNGTADFTSTVVNTTLGTHTVRLTKTSAANTHVGGIRVWNSTAKEIEIFQAGWAGGKSSNFVTSANPWDMLPVLTTLAPDLTILQLGINDWYEATNVATFKSQMQTVINTLKLSGDVILTAETPTSAAEIPLATQALYINAVRELAAENGLLVLDLNARFGSYEASTAYYANAVHPNGLGYKDAARAAAALVTL